MSKACGGRGASESAGGKGGGDRSDHQRASRAAAPCSQQTAAETRAKEMEATSECFNSSLTNGRDGIQIQSMRKQSE